MDILLEVIYPMLESLKSKKEMVVIAIAGGGCLGKTTLAQKLEGILYPSRVQTINLDGYMLPREEAYLIEPGMTGYDLRRNNLVNASNNINNLVKYKIPFEQNGYDRGTHKLVKKNVVMPKPFIIIEGVHALHEYLLPLVDYGIFIDATEEVQFTLRYKRECFEFGYDEKEVKKRWQKYWPDYLKYVAPQARLADVILEVDDEYNLMKKGG